METELTANEKKSAGVQARWDRDKQIEGRLDKNDDRDRMSKKFNYTCFDKLHLFEKQKQFIVVFMDAPHFGRKENIQKAYREVYNPSTDNSCRSNSSAMLAKSKIKEGILAYQKYSLLNHKIEVTSESIENLRRMANYSVTTFYRSNGDPKGLDEIDAEWLICIDSIEVDYKVGKDFEKRIPKYKLCDRKKAMDSLQKLLGVSQEMEKIEVSVPTGGKNIIDSVGENNSQPRIVLNMSVGNPFKEE